MDLDHAEKLAMIGFYMSGIACFVSFLFSSIRSDREVRKERERAKKLYQESMGEIDRQIRRRLAGQTPERNEIFN